MPYGVVRRLVNLVYHQTDGRFYVVSLRREILGGKRVLVYHYLEYPACFAELFYMATLITTVNFYNNSNANYFLVDQIFEGLGEHKWVDKGFRGMALMLSKH